MENFDMTIYLLSALWGMSFAAILKLAWDLFHIGNVKDKKNENKEDEPKSNDKRVCQKFQFGTPSVVLCRNKVTIYMYRKNLNIIVCFIPQAFKMAE